MKKMIFTLFTVLSLATTAFGQGSVTQTSATTPICAGMEVAYAYSGTCSFPSWQIEGGGTIVSSTANTVRVLWSSATTSGYVIARCSSSPSLTVGLPVTVNALVTPAVTFTGPTTVCGGASSSYQASPTNGGTAPSYTWLVNGVSKQSGSSASFATTQLVQGDVVSVQMTSNLSCVTTSRATSSGLTIGTVTPPLPVSVSISGPASFCPGQSSGAAATYSASATNGGASPTYTWYKNGSAVSDNELTGNQYRPHYGLGDGDKITCRLNSSLTGCIANNGSLSNEITVRIINETPFLRITSSKDSFCQGDEVTFTATSNFPLSNIQWKIDNSVAMSSSPTFTISSLSATNTVYLTATPNTTCSTSATLSANTQGLVTIYPALVAAMTPTGTKRICSTCSELLTATTGPGYGYQWMKDNQAIAGATTATYTARSTGNYTVVISKGGCSSKASNAFALKTNQLPVVNAGSDVTVTAPNSVQLTGSASDPDGSISSYQWSVVSGNADMVVLSDASLTPTVSGLLIGTYVFRLTATDNDFKESKSDEITITVLAPPNNYNYKRETTALVAALTESTLNGLPVTQKSVSTTYIDGLGRTMQQIGWKASPNQYDIIQPVVYDELSRQRYQYLPVVATTTDGYYKPNASLINSTTQVYQGIAAGFYQAGSANMIADDARPYEETTFEPSPLNRPLTMLGVGNEWFSKNKAVTSQYLTNVHGTATGQEQIIAWTLDASGLAIRNTAASLNGGTGYYPSGTLVVSSTQDEQGNQVRQYTSKEGRLLLKKVQALPAPAGLNDVDGWAQTYYLYDNFGNLRYVFQPELSKALVKSAGNPTAPQLAQLAFQYSYDERQRLVIKRIPGADPVYLVYDERNRLVMTQDGAQRPNKQWSYTQYDLLNRPLISGLYTHGSIIDQPAMTALQSTSVWYETYNGVAATHGYTNTVFASGNFNQSGFEVLSVTYYDAYDFKSLLNDVTYDYQSGVYSDQYKDANGNSLLKIKGVVAGTKVKVLGQTLYLWSVQYFDDKYRPVQQIVSNYQGGKDVSTMVYDFVGKVVKTKTVHSTASTTVNTARSYTYDHGQRLKQTWHSVNGSTPVLLSASQYNELGQLVAKKLHSTNNGVSFNQSVDYRYNIRGWLERINNWDLTADNANDAPDLFGMNLLYDQTETALANVAQYNGNISAAKWSTNQGLSEIRARAYAYTYDAMNRLASALPKTNTASWQTSTSFDEKDIRYDLNGNIQLLNRYGANSGFIDQLTYDYGTGAAQSNRLLSVTDGKDAVRGFADGNKAGNDYSYDGAGRLTGDKNKGLTIIYNSLHLPEKVTKSSGEYLTYAYDATGRKLGQKVYNAAGTLSKETVYAGEFIYDKSILQFINHEEGRVVMTGSNAEYQYHYKDHLGNIRLTFTTQPGQDVNTATLETVSRATEQNQFQRYDLARLINSSLFDHTGNGSTTYAQRLNGTANEKYGLAKSLSVMPGDKIKLEVFAKYLDPNQNNWTTAVKNLIAAIAAGTAPAGTVVDGAGYATSGQVPFPYAGLGGTSGSSGTGPKAFLNWLVFDRDYVFKTGGYVRMSELARETGSDVAHEKLTSELSITEAGYVYVYVSNENATPIEVYFDDLKVSQIQSPVVQTDDYYPFGLSFNSYSRENAVPQQYGYNGKEMQDELNFGWLDYGARMYDPQIGRWHAVDPKAEKTPNFTSYNYCKNDPVNYVDPDGNYTVSTHYNMTYIILRGSGYNEYMADKIAYFASTYADHPLEKFLNPFINSGDHLKYGRFGVHYGKGPTKDSQADDPENSRRHSMMSNAEAENGYSHEESMERGLDFGFSNIIDAAQSGKLENLGVGLHAIQDAYAHEGMSTDEHLNFKDNFWSASSQMVEDVFSLGIGKPLMMTSEAVKIYDIITGQQEQYKQYQLKDGSINLYINNEVSKKTKGNIINAIINSGFTGVIKFR